MILLFFHPLCQILHHLVYSLILWCSLNSSNAVCIVWPWLLVVRTSVLWVKCFSPLFDLRLPPQLSKICFLTSSVEVMAPPLSSFTDRFMRVLITSLTVPSSIGAQSRAHWCLWWSFLVLPGKLVIVPEGRFPGNPALVPLWFHVNLRSCGLFRSMSCRVCQDHDWSQGRSRPVLSF